MLQRDNFTGGAEGKNMLQRDNLAGALKGLERRRQQAHEEHGWEVVS